MNQRKETSFTAKRLLDIREAAAYVGLGTTKTREWLTDIGALRRFGRRSLYDREIIDNALNRLGTETTMKEV